MTSRWEYLGVEPPDAARECLTVPHVAFRRFPRAAWHLMPWGHIVEARRSDSDTPDAA